ncbi:MAG: 30S ribosomal protein S2 [archaeon]
MDKEIKTKKKVAKEIEASSVIEEKIVSPSNLDKEIKASDNRAPAKEDRNLVNVDLYLKNGIHIGTKFKNGAMRKFIFKARPDKLNVMDIQKIDRRIRSGIDFIQRFKPEDVVFVSRKKYSHVGIKLLEKTFAFKSRLNRFVPGSFTNPESALFIEPKLVFISDPNVDRQAILEAKKAKIPVMALATTSSNVRDIDYIIPYNNKGRSAIALFFWLLNRELQLRNGIIKSPTEFPYTVESFTYTLNDDQKTGLKIQRRVSEFDKNKRGRFGSGGGGSSGSGGSRGPPGGSRGPAGPRRSY